MSGDGGNVVFVWCVKVLVMENLKFWKMSMVSFRVKYSLDIVCVAMLRWYTREGQWRK